MIINISEAKYVVGTKQTVKAISSGAAEAVFIAEDADEDIKEKVKRECRKHSVEYTSVPTMKELGNACNISRSAAVACNIK